MGDDFWYHGHVIFLWYGKWTPLCRKLSFPTPQNTSISSVQTKYYAPLHPYRLNPSIIKSHQVQCRSPIIYSAKLICIWHTFAVGLHSQSWLELSFFASPGLKFLWYLSYSQLSTTYSAILQYSKSCIFCRCITSKCTWPWSFLAFCMGLYFYLWVTYSCCSHLLYDCLSPEVVQSHE